jgi:hypothetical protein
MHHKHLCRKHNRAHHVSCQTGGAEELHTGGAAAAPKEGRAQAPAPGDAALTLPLGGPVVSWPRGGVAAVLQGGGSPHAASIWLPSQRMHSVALPAPGQT